MDQEEIFGFNKSKLGMFESTKMFLRLTYLEINFEIYIQSLSN